MSADVETNRVLKEHAERIAALEAVLRHLATKADIESVRSEIQSLRSDLKAMRWLIGVAIGLASVLFTVINVLVDLALRT